MCFKGFWKKVKRADDILHHDRLISALNKYWRPIEEDYFWDEMDLIDTNNAVAIASFPEEVSSWIWVRKRVLGELF